MEKFFVTFKLVNGDNKHFDEVSAIDYADLASKIMRSTDGWFGVKGDVVNLSNVLTCQISELDENGYTKE